MWERFSNHEEKRHELQWEVEELEQEIKDYEKVIDQEVLTLIDECNSLLKNPSLTYTQFSMKNEILKVALKTLKEKLEEQIELIRNRP